MKDPRCSHTLYVAELIGPDVVNTMPEQTLKAFADHGEVVRTLDTDRGAAPATLVAAARAGLDLDAITATLEREGVRSFCDSYHQLLGLHREQARCTRSGERLMRGHQATGGLG